ncbi:hypothetical protein [Nocardia australiensis]|uniref:hypothetical protein n=1 Tax=Nocardia australiensis TaxID=2887191 RepID=UPI001D148C29|nr:hypothetical protein [Nocardia australiensis]
MASQRITSYRIAQHGVSDGTATARRRRRHGLGGVVGDGTARRGVGDGDGWR